MVHGALDLGGSKVSICLASADGRQQRHQVQVGETGEPTAVLSEVVATLQDWAGTQGLLDTLAIASAPAMDARGTVSLWPNRPQWHGVPLAAELARRLQCRVIWCDDGTAAAIADADALSCDNLLQFTLGTGVAGGIVYRGRAFGDRELGHLTVNPEGPACSCGRRGCLQAYASSRSLASAAGDGTPAREQAWLEAASTAIAVCAANLVELFRVETISLSGGLLLRFRSLPELVERRLSDGALKPSLPVPRVRASPYGAEASLWGALRLARSDAEFQQENCRTLISA